MNLDQALGSIIGLAIGDALGAPVEFCQRGRFTALTGLREGAKFKMRLGEWSDDTAMALCLAESLIECGRLIQSAKLNGHQTYGYRKDILERLPTQKTNKIDVLAYAEMLDM